MSADLRSIHPNLPGFPWWGAVVMAVTTTVAGIAFDAANKELANVFGALYVLGCVAAVLMVQQSGVFTAVIQPPLILFCAVPGAYWLFNGAQFTGVKTVLINCGYPLIERFPLMLFTSAGVLLIGMGRWYFATTPAAAAKADGKSASGPGWLKSINQKLTTRIAAALERRPAHAGEPTARRRRSPERSRRSTSTPRSSGAPRRFAPTHSRNGRAPADSTLRARAERPRRTGPGAAAPEEPPLQRRRRPAPESARRGGPRRESRRRDSQREVHLHADPHQPRRRRAPNPGADPTHHPISRVRYRNPDPGAESWEYDI